MMMMMMTALKPRKRNKNNPENANTKIRQRAWERTTQGNDGVQHDNKSKHGKHDGAKNMDCDGDGRADYDATRGDND